MNVKKRVCPECGHTLYSGFCRNCFLKDMENTDYAIQQHKKALNNVNEKVKRTLYRTFGFLILILIATFFVGVGVGFSWGLFQ